MFSRFLLDIRIFIETLYGRKVLLMSKDEVSAKAEITRMKRSWRKFNRLCVKQFRRLYDD